ncbi:uncharacterized protein [Apostichopus japonicus]|uniref:uncharacterized protein n=1 Tax=Stichopus japonicus TaxID=307972 RepID=UPI003AB39CB3
MASPLSILEDMDERLCQCSVCFEEYKNPRQLPCFHRYCADCLEQLITQNQGVLVCPLCKKQVDIPNEGVEGFPKDYYMDEIIDDIQVKRSLKDGQSDSTSNHLKETSGEHSNLPYRKYIKTYDVRLSDQDEWVVDVDGIKGSGWYIRGMTCTANGTIVVTGDATDKQAHISVVNMDGKVLVQRILEARQTSFSTSPCFCTSFKDYRVAIACDPDEVGLFDVRDGTYEKRNIKDIATNWPAGRGVRCIGYDKANSHIFVGCYKSRDVYVLDSNLNYLRTVRLPTKIKWPFDLSVGGGNLLVCDRDGQSACALTLEGELLYEFPKPAGNRCKEPVSICADKNGFVYILWKETWFKCEQDSIITQYSQDGRSILSAISNYTDSGWITTQDTGKTSKLLMTTWTSGQMYAFNLVNQNALNK